ncbi:MAG TPA: hypothetical protein VFO60_00420, partial [Candidatus Dormibacteraeota bacterium]|nr:hypothetical protein [Candidatus Dormibacteraeota bacterium]
MTGAINVISWIQSVGIALIALATAIAWAGHRTVQRGWLALAIGLLGLVSVVGRIQQVTGFISLTVTHLTLVAFLASGFALALFRDSVVPLPRPVRELLFAMLVAISAAGFVISLPLGLSPSPTAAQWALVWAFILYWCGCVAEPGIRFWTASRGRPIVQRTRLRALSAGYVAIVVILLVAFGIGIVGGPRLLINQQYQLIVGILGLATVPVLYIGFAPPQWLRRIWRDREEAALRAATAELLLARDPIALAESSLHWALRLVGADR